jgi:hypothetical protein
VGTSSTRSSHLLSIDHLLMSVLSSPSILTPIVERPSTSTNKVVGCNVRRGGNGGWNSLVASCFMGQELDKDPIESTEYSHLCICLSRWMDRVSI